MFSWPYVRCGVGATRQNQKFQNETLVKSENQNRDRVMIMSDANSQRASKALMLGFSR